MQKYKVFISDCWIFFGDFKQSQFNENEKYEVLNASENLIFILAEMIKTGNFDENIVLKNSDNDIDYFDFFLKQFLVLEAAGGIVRHLNNAFLMINRFDVWDFPKGKIEEGERNNEAALREVKEETGVENIKIVHELPTSYHIYRYGRQWIAKRTFWYLMKSDYTGKLVPQTEEDIHEAVWVPKSELSSYLTGTYGNLKEMVKESGLI